MSLRNPALDCHLIINKHVSTVARTSYFELHRLAFILRFLTIAATATLVSAFILQKMTIVAHCCLVILMI